MHAGNSASTSLDDVMHLHCCALESIGVRAPQSHERHQFSASVDGGHVAQLDIAHGPFLYFNGAVVTEFFVE
jgi:hypothetical protein